MIVGLGLDLVDIARVERMLESKGERALRRLFTEREVDYAHARQQPSHHLAARIAAKEATFKALAGATRARAIGWREMEVVSASDGRPTIVLHGTAKECADELGVGSIRIALSHSALTAGAVVICECRP